MVSMRGLEYMVQDMCFEIRGAGHVVQLLVDCGARGQQMPSSRP